MIWFKKIIPTKIITNSYINYDLVKLKISNTNIMIDETNLNKYMYIQQIQTLNVISGAKSIDQIEKKCIFENICRGFMIRMYLSDYNNLKQFKIILNGHVRIELTKCQIELMDIKKFISMNHVLIYLDLEIGNLKWGLPQSIDEIRSIYSNSLNCSRIDTNVFKFEFDTKYIQNNIQISSLSLNFLNIKTNELKYKYF